MGSVKIFIEYLRNLNEPAKRVWLFVLSGISMAFVMALWVIYLNATISEIGEAKIAAVKKAEAEAQAEAENRNPLFANFKKNASTISKNFSGLIKSLVNKKNEILIK